MFRGYRHKYKKSEWDWQQSQLASGIVWIPPFPSLLFTATSGLLASSCSSWAQLWLYSSLGSSTATLNNSWKLQSDPPRINYSVELVHICHSHRNNHLHSGNYCFSTNKPCSSELPRDWSFEFIIKYLSQDLRSPLAISLYPEAPQTNEDPPLSLLTPIHHHSVPRGQG